LKEKFEENMNRKNPKIGKREIIIMMLMTIKKKPLKEKKERYQQKEGKKSFEIKILKK